jgi:hypothetical protein
MRERHLLRKTTRAMRTNSSCHSVRSIVRRRTPFLELSLPLFWAWETSSRWGGKRLDKCGHVTRNPHWLFRSRSAYSTVAGCGRAARAAGKPIPRPRYRPAIYQVSPAR